MTPERVLTLVIGGRYIPIDGEQSEVVVMQIGRRR